MHPNQLSDSDVAVLLEYIQFYLLIIIILLHLRSPESVISITMAGIVIDITGVYAKKSAYTPEEITEATSLHASIPLVASIISSDSGLLIT